MEKRRNKSAAGSGKDRISELPDEILHHILRCSNRYDEAAQTIALSKRWRRVWQSYPVVHYDRYQPRSSVTFDFQKFIESTIQRFSRDKLLRIESLKLYYAEYKDRIVSLEPLLDLALERKAEDVRILVHHNSNHPSLPYRLLFNSIIKSLRLANVYFAFDRYFHRDSPTSLQSLYLCNVEFGDSDLLTNLMANSPMLETLKLRYFGKISKLQVSKVPNLKELEISALSVVKEIEIVAPRLQSLFIRDMGIDRDIKIELIAAQLNVLEVSEVRLTQRDLEGMVSKLPSLKYLSLKFITHSRVEKLKLSCSSLVEFQLRLSADCRLEEIELDAGSDLEKFFLHYDESHTHKLKKCEISNAGSSCRPVVFYPVFDRPSSHTVYHWLVGFRNFIRTSNFHTVIIHTDSWAWESPMRIYDRKIHRGIHRGTIDYLKIKRTFSDFREEAVLLNHLLWACQPKMLTIPDQSYEYNRHKFFSLKKFHGRSNWRRQLKDVKIERREGHIGFWLTWHEC